MVPKSMTRTELIKHTNKDEKLQFIKKKLTDGIDVGNEQLQISFTGSLAAAVQVDVFAYCQSAIEQGAGFVKVYAL